MGSSVSRKFKKVEENGAKLSCSARISTIEQKKAPLGQPLVTSRVTKNTWIKDKASLTPDKIDLIVQETWNTIAQQIDKATLNKCDISLPLVRVFVSSTFTDMHNEREILVKQVFPQLRDWCAERRISLIETDLRWGVPKDSTSSDTIRTCLWELDRCHSQNGGQPFFVGLLGERYGWIPDEEEVPEDLQQVYNWIPNISITHMEILHGTWRMENPSAIFFLRDPNVLQSINPGHLEKFRDTSAFSLAQLKELKQRIRNRFEGTHQCFTYQCAVEPAANSTSVKLEQLEWLAHTTLDFLKRSIANRYQMNDRAAQSAVERDSTMQNYFVKSTLDTFVGRHKELTLLRQYLDKTIDGSLDVEKLPVTMKSTEDAKKNPHEYGECPWLENGMPLFYVQAPYGIGKTSLLAKFASEAQKWPDFATFIHFPGAGSAYKSTSGLLRRLITFSGCKTECPENDFEKTKDIWRNEALPLLCSNTGQKFLIILDALDQVDTHCHTNHLNWLPQYFPSNVFCICSARSDEWQKYTVSRLECRGPYRLLLEQVNIADKEMYVDNYLNRYSKKLDVEQKTLLLCATPDLHWIALALEELRIFGDFRAITSVIKRLPENFDDLVRQVVIRVLAEATTKYEEKTLTFLCCGRRFLDTMHNQYEDTLYEEDLRALLGESNLPLSALDWHKTRIALGNLIQIDANAKVAYAVLLKDLSVARQYHAMLATYYNNQTDHRHGIFLHLYSHHLLNAGLKQNVIQFFLFDKRIFDTSDQFHRRKIMQEVRCRNLIQANIPAFENMTAFMCNKCASQLRFGVYSVERNCLICGAPFSLNAGKLCFMHYNAYMLKCVVCGGQPARAPWGQEIRICSVCDFGISRCCYLAE